MARTVKEPLRVRLAQGDLLPIPASESIDGTTIITSDSDLVLVRNSSWARRRIARGDLVIVREEPVISLEVDELELTPFDDEEF